MPNSTSSLSTLVHVLGKICVCTGKCEGICIYLKGVGDNSTYLFIPRMCSTVSQNNRDQPAGLVLMYAEEMQFMLKLGAPVRIRPLIPDQIPIEVNGNALIDYFTISQICPKSHGLHLGFLLPVL